MFSLGIGELTLIFLIVLVVFGARKLPEIGEGLGKGILNFRRSVKQIDEPTSDSSDVASAQHGS